jgi:hypothetical protein
VAAAGPARGYRGARGRCLRRDADARLRRTTILGLAGAGELPRLRAGRAVRYAVGDIEHLVERRRSATQVAAEAAGIFRLSPGDQQH